MKVAQALRAQLKQGADPKGLALTCAFGASLAIIPVLGSTTALCLLAGAVFRLNQPVLQTINYLLYPVQLGLIPLFLVFGAKLTGSVPLSLDPRAAAPLFFSDPAGFLAKFGMAGMHAVFAWALFAPILFYAVFKLTHPVFLRWRK